MTIKRIFSDMDGTLLNSQGRLSSETIHSIRQAKIPVTLVSARAPMEMMDAIEALELTGPQVAFNGGLIYQVAGRDIHPLHVDILHRQSAQAILAAVRQHFPQVSISYYDMTHWYCDTIDEGIRYEYQLTGQTPTLVREQADFLAAKDNTFKIMMITFDNDQMVALEKYLQSLDLGDISIQRSGQYYLEITSKTAKKSKGIHYILKKEGLEKSQTAAFGDGHNDIPMLEMVGYPIVMGNAYSDIKELAYKVTRSNDEDGVGYGIKKYLSKLNQKSIWQAAHLF